MSAPNKLSWWWSRDGERYQGPCNDRAEALLDAWGDDPDVGAYLCQATQGDMHTDLFEGWHIAERFDEANEETGDPDGDPPSSLVDDAEWDALAERLNATVKAVIGRKGLSAWSFVNQKDHGFVDLPKIMAALSKAEGDPA